MSKFFALALAAGLSVVGSFFPLVGSSVSAKTGYYDCQMSLQKLPPSAKYIFTGYSRQKYIYKNNQFGYQFLFPKSWGGLNVFQEQVHTADLGSFYYHYFSLPYKNKQSITECYQSIFALYVYTNQQWDKIKNEEGPVQYFLGKNNQYSFVLELAQSFIDDSFEPYWDEVLATIVPTFKITNI